MKKLKRRPRDSAPNPTPDPTPSTGEARVRVGELIYLARTEAGLTQTELSRLSGIDQGHISKYELGKTVPSGRLHARLLEHLPTLDIPFAVLAQARRRNPQNPRSSQ